MLIVPDKRGEHMICRKCNRDLPEDAVFCCYCGVKQVVAPKRTKKRANGMGCVRKRGSTYTAIGPSRQVFVNGEMKTVRPTQGGFRTRTEALLAAPTIGIRKREDRSKLTFSEVYAAWLERHRTRVSAGTLGCYTAAYNHYKPLYPARFVDLVTEDWQGCVDDCTAGKRTRENMKALGTLMYKYVMEQNITDKNFAQFIYIGKVDTVSRNAFTRDELLLIKEGAEKGVKWADYILCACLLGFRPTALFALKKEDYLEDECALVGGIKTDAGRNRIVPISPIIRPYIARLMKSDSEYIFPNRHGEQMTAANFRNEYFYGCLETLGVQKKPEADTPAKYTPYSCRHTFFTLMARVPGEDKVKAELGGHTSYEMSKHYQHPDLTDKRNIINAISL